MNRNLPGTLIPEMTSTGAPFADKHFLVPPIILNQPSLPTPKT